MCLNHLNCVMSRRFQEDDEIQKVANLCHKFGEVFPLPFPERNITCKIHDLVFSVLRFITKFKTIGMLSQQEGESKHASINAELRPMACMRSHSERICLVLEKEELRSSVYKAMIQPKPRLCANCTVLEKKKHCTLCEHQYFVLRNEKCCAFLMFVKLGWSAHSFFPPVCFLHFPFCTMKSIEYLCL